MRFILFITFLLLSSVASAQKDTTAVDTNKVYTLVEQMPEYPGGDIELIKAVQKGLNFNCEEDGLTGDNVMFKFIVERDGSVSNVSVKAWCKGMEISGIKSIQSLKFIPAKQRGIPVRVYFNLPMHIRLSR